MLVDGLSNTFLTKRHKKVKSSFCEFYGNCGYNIAENLYFSGFQWFIITRNNAI